MALYHKEVYWPFKNTPQGVWAVTYSNHAIQAASDDRYGRIPLAPTIDLSSLELFEIETKDNKIVKIVGRARLDATRDICYAILVANKLVKTVWVNLRSDKHRTLRKEQYVCR